ncbi:MAG: Acyl-CoA synthetase [Ignavibacteria bacterium]|nr:Acyl-CoA synthetase [Ignavibacteria bacterium]
MFYNFDIIQPEKIAVIESESDIHYPYSELDDYSNFMVELLSGNKKRLSFLFCNNTFGTIASYIGILRSGNAVLLLDKNITPELRENLINIYKPELLINFPYEEQNGYRWVCGDKFTNLVERLNVEDLPHINPELAVLLSTSGTTGSPKLVRLTYKNLQSNALSIMQYLSITEYDKPITSLPMSYSYGLSVINSHLLAGATIIATNKSLVNREFWTIFNKYECSSFAGVPYHYQMLMRLRFEKMELPSLRKMTQAGGRLSEEFIRYFYDASLKKQIKFFVMYGQTEATARISYLPWERLCEKIGSIGIPIPGGKIVLMGDGAPIRTVGIEGELVYYGDNVMLGYATSREDLAKGDELGGMLQTGDIARRDADGYYYITGRMKRFIKLFGLRLNLDEIEKMLENRFSLPVAAIGTDDRLILVAGEVSRQHQKEILHSITETYKIHHSVVEIVFISKIPVTQSGKKDYAELNELVK